MMSRHPGRRGRPSPGGRRCARIATRLTGWVVQGRQRSALRGIERRLLAEDPALAARLRGDARPAVSWHLSRWRPRWFALAAAMFLGLGMFLDVGSSVLFGLVLLGITWWRRRELAGRARLG